MCLRKDSNRKEVNTANVNRFLQKYLLYCAIRFRLHILIILTIIPELIISMGITAH